MDKILNDKGCENLVNAIYEQAARDYINAIIHNNKRSMKEIEEFLVSGAYFKLPAEGEYIKRKCLVEIKICNKFINKFLESDLERILIDKKAICYSILMMIKEARYKNKLSFETKKGKLYLYRKKKALTD